MFNKKVLISLAFFHLKDHFHAFPKHCKFFAFSILRFEIESKTQTSIQISTCLFYKIALFELNRVQFHSVVLTINTNYLVVTKGFPFNGEMAQQEEKLS